MISKQNRFHGHGALKNAYTKGQTARGEFLSLRHLTTRRDDYRLAVVVSKKVSKSAVVRNRIRRRIYEVVRTYKKEAAQNWNKDLIISVYDERAASQPPEELRASILRLLQKAGL